ncbi:MAG: hypothetical protein LN409_03915 [Candidatus Thermoplasmatota archaeon]|nr:hypothetical protein [Candidatus Thermoplasmatota archaeon]
MPVVAMVSIGLWLVSVILMDIKVPVKFRAPIVIAGAVIACSICIVCFYAATVVSGVVMKVFFPLLGIVCVGLSAWEAEASARVGKWKR